MLQLQDGKSLVLLSVSGLVDGASVVCAGAAVGRFVDAMPRLAAARLMYVLQNAGVFASAGCILVALELAPRGSPAFWICVTGT